MTDSPRDRVQSHHLTLDAASLDARLVEVTDAATAALAELSQVADYAAFRAFPESSFAKVQTALRHLREVFPDAQAQAPRG